MTGDPRKVRGKIGELAANQLLLRDGYIICDVNWRCRIGEIDIVAEKDGVLVFVEVRTRTERSLGGFGTPFESITHKKQYKVRKVAEAYVQRTERTAAIPRTVRFDCISVLLNDRNEPASVTHLTGAF